jgi:hypothetical protein
MTSSIFTTDSKVARMPIDKTTRMYLALRKVQDAPLGRLEQIRRARLATYVENHDDIRQTAALKRRGITVTPANKTPSLRPFPFTKASRHSARLPRGSRARSVARNSIWIRTDFSTDRQSHHDVKRDSKPKPLANI